METNVGSSDTAQKSELKVEISVSDSKPEKGAMETDGHAKKEGTSGGHGGESDKNASTAEAVAVLEITHQDVKDTSGVQYSPREKVVASSMGGEKTNAEDQAALHTLEEYSHTYFRPPVKKGMFRHHTEDKLWSYSKEPIKEPLLKKTLINQDLAKQAVHIYTLILAYINDLKRSRGNTEVTDHIFRPAIIFEPLRDEVYCQIMKQLTHNKHKHTEERCWELMLLVTGLFTCSETLLPHLVKFLLSRQSIEEANQSYARFQSVLKTGHRKQPPNLIEVNAVQNKSKEMTHLVHFPNGATQPFVVHYWTRAKELSQLIVQHVKLLSGEGFNLFVNFADKVLSIPDNDFLFDFVGNAIDWTRTMKSKESGDQECVAMINCSRAVTSWTLIPCNHTPAITADVDVGYLLLSGAGSHVASYQIYFMRKLWLNVVPGKDVNADCVFHYHQELPKVLRGYHPCSKEEAIELAALQYRVRYGEDKTEFGQISHKRQEYVPEDLLSVMTPENWRKEIEAAHSRHTDGMTRSEAKVAFMKIVGKWPTFGCSFYDVKQNSHPEMPEILVIGISMHGVTIFESKTKAKLQSFPFSRISTWSSGHGYFHITFGNLVKGTKLTCFTPMGYKMDDLITSYISHLLEKKGQTWPQRR